VELDVEAAQRAVGTLGHELGLGLEETAAGITRVASAGMAQAVRVVTVERGVDPRELALVAFGGAGPLHAAQIAAELGMNRVVAPLSSGVLSAVGLVVSERRRDVVESVLLSGPSLTREAVASAVDRLGARGREDLDAPEAQLRATYELRYAGQAFELPVEGELAPEPRDLRRAFDRAHTERYGYEDPEAELELVTIRVAAVTGGGELMPAEAGTERERGTRKALFDGERHDTAVYGEGRTSAAGPAIFELPGSTLVVPPGWRAQADEDAVILERAA
jgi:N-methylhydantoinase A/oxoprolinase/acetone carboxylase beta subunit